MKVRHVARTLVLDSNGALLLLRYEDPGAMDPDHPGIVAYWVPPGGAVKANESHEAAAERELAEETGLLGKVGPPIWVRQFVMPYQKRLVSQVERYFLVRLTIAQPRVANQTPDEAIVEMRWWSLDELRGSNELFFPDGLVELIAPVIAGVVPKKPVDI